MNKPKENNGFFGKIGNFFDKTVKKAEEAAVIVGKKVKEMEIGEKLKEGGEKTWTLVKEGGGFIAEKSKQAYVFKISLFRIQKLFRILFINQKKE